CRPISRCSRAATCAACSTAPGVAASRTRRARTSTSSEVVRRGQAQAAHFHALPPGGGRPGDERAAFAQGDGQGRPDRGVRPAMIGRRRLTTFLGAALLPTVGRADDFPIKPITLVVPFTPGGSIDMLARLVAQQASVALGQPIVVDN